MIRFSRLASVLLAVMCMFSGAAADHAVEPTIEESFAEPPREENYILEEGKAYAVGYEDPTLKISITEGRYLDTTWTAARIKVAYPGQLRTCMYKDRYGAGWGQGELYRLRCDQSGNRYDILCIDDQGDFHALLNAKDSDITDFDGKIVNAFVFGPAVVYDYKAREVTEDNQMGAFHKTQRMGIGQIGPLEYICVCCEGPEDPGSQGLTVQEFGELVASFGDVRIFYNLDGGSSATMVFKGLDKRGNETLYAKINAPQNLKVRQAGGCIYFTSAWVTSDMAETEPGDE